MEPGKNYWPLGIILAFVLFFAGMATVVVIATTHREDLVSREYYELELKFQDQIDALARAQKAGAYLRFDAAAGRVLLALPPAQLSRKFAGKVTFYRADAPGLDREYILAPNPEGAQQFSVSRFSSGPWQVRASWTADGQAYFLEEKFVVAAK